MSWSEATFRIRAMVLLANETDRGLFVGARLATGYEVIAVRMATCSPWLHRSEGRNVSPASHMGPPARTERQQHGTTPAPVMGPPQRQ
jgi:hypothetical protein